MYIPSDTLITNSLSEATHTSQTSPRLQHMWHGSWLLMRTVADAQSSSVPIDHTSYTLKEGGILWRTLPICSHLSFCPPPLHSHFLKFKSGSAFYFFMSNKVAASQSTAQTKLKSQRMECVQCREKLWKLKLLSSNKPNQTNTQRNFWESYNL